MGHLLFIYLLIFILFESWPKNPRKQAKCFFGPYWMTPFTLFVYDWISRKRRPTKQLCRPILTISPTQRMPRGSEPRGYHAPSNCVAPSSEAGHPETLDLPTHVTVDCTSSRRCQVSLSCRSEINGCHSFSFAQL